LIRDELDDIRDEFGDERRTEIIAGEGEFEIEDLIAEEDMIITITHAGYIKRISTGTYRQQRRGGRGVKGMEMKDEDFVEHLFIASTHSYIMFFTDRGKCYWLKVHEIPRGGRLSKGKAVVNLLQLSSEERITAFIQVEDFDRDAYLMMATREGYVKKTHLSEYSNPRRDGIKAIVLKGDDSLVRVAITTGNDDIILARKSGRVIRFNEEEARGMGRVSRGVKGLKMKKGGEVKEMVVVKSAKNLLFVTENGYGKRVRIKDIRNQKRGGMGLKAMPAEGRNGPLVTVKEVFDTDEFVMITRKGLVVKSPVSDVRVMRRQAQGVRVIRLDQDDRLMDVALVASEGTEEPGGGKQEEDKGSEEE